MSDTSKAVCRRKSLQSNDAVRKKNWAFSTLLSQNDYDDDDDDDDYYCYDTIILRRTLYCYQKRES